MLICSECMGKTDRLRTEKSWHLELDPPSVEEIQIEVCPCCGARDTLSEAVECSFCGGEFLDIDNFGNICDECLEKYETVGEALAIGAENTLEVKGINGFAASVLSVEQINKILIKWVEENFVDHSKAVKEYCEDDKTYFVDWIEERYGKANIF